MKTLLPAVFSFVFLLTAVDKAQADDSALNTDLKSKMITHVPLTKDTSLLVVVARDEAVAAKKGLTSDASIDHWYFLGDGYREHRLIGSAMAGMLVVGSILKSPNGKYLAVESSGEGVTSLEIIEVESLISKGIYKPVWDSSHFLKCNMPGWIGAKKWNEQSLIVESDTWLPKCKPKELQKKREFSIDAKSGKVTPL